MPTYNADLLPNAPGLNLGNASQPWDGEFRNVVILGSLTYGSVTNSSANASYTVVNFSASPTFVPTGSTVFSLTLTGNVTSSVFSSAGLTIGALEVFIIRQDGTGGHTFVWPTVCKGVDVIGTTASQTTAQSFVWDGSNLIAIGQPVIF